MAARLVLNMGAARFRACCALVRCPSVALFWGFAVVAFEEHIRLGLSSVSESAFQRLCGKGPGRHLNVAADPSSVLLIANMGGQDDAFDFSL